MPKWRLPRRLKELVAEGDEWRDERWHPLRLTATGDIRHGDRDIPMAWQIEFEPADCRSPAALKEIKRLGLEPDGYGWVELIKTEFAKRFPDEAEELHLDDTEMATGVIWVESTGTCRKLTELAWQLIHSSGTARPAKSSASLTARAARKTRLDNTAQEQEKRFRSMKIHVSEFYVEPGATYPFSHIFSRWMSEQLSERVEPSEMFTRNYSKDFNLVFRLSAKASLTHSEISGPTVFRRTKDVEYSIFLPHEGRPPKTKMACKEPLRMFLESVVKVLQSLKADTRLIEADVPALIEHVVSEPTMFEEFQPVRIFIKQAYPDARVGYPFNELFDHQIGLDLTEEAKPTETFKQKFGQDFDIVFNIGAKLGLTNARIENPKVFKRDKRIEISIFLPHDGRKPKSQKDCLNVFPQFLDSVVAALRKLGVDADQIVHSTEYMIATITAAEGWFSRAYRVACR